MNNQMDSNQMIDLGHEDQNQLMEARVAQAFSDRLRQVIGNRSVLKFSQECGISDSLMRKYLAGSQPGLGKLVRLAEVGGVSVEWLATGRGVAPRTLGARTGSGNVTTLGSGALPPLFERNWLQGQERRERGAFTHAVAMGDAMEPTISSGAPLLLDTDINSVRHDGIYVLRWAGESVPKRLQLEWSGGVWVRSDNPAYEDQFVAAESVGDLQVVGRVVWVGQRL